MSGTFVPFTFGFCGSPNEFPRLDRPPSRYFQSRYRTTDDGTRVVETYDGSTGDSSGVSPACEKSVPRLRPCHCDRSLFAPSESAMRHDRSSTPLSLVPPNKRNRHIGFVDFVTDLCVLRKLLVNYLFTYLHIVDSRDFLCLPCEFNPLKLLSNYFPDKYSISVHTTN